MFRYSGCLKEWLDIQWTKEMCVEVWMKKYSSYVIIQHFASELHFENYTRISENRQLLTVFYDNDILMFQLYTPHSDKLF